MEDKKQGPPNLDYEISSIENEFNVIFRELAQYSYIGNYGNVFRQLRQLLIDSHNKNKSLAQVVQNLNQEIIENATKVQSLLKMSENDTMEIEKYKASYKKVLAFVSVSQAKEIWTKDLCESLKKKLGELSNLVAEQSINENNQKQLHLDLLNYVNEKKSQNEQIQKISKDTEDIQNQIQKNKNDTVKAADQIQTIEEAIKIENENRKEILNSNELVQNEVDKITNSNDELTSNNKNIMHEISLLKKKLWEIRQELQNQRDIETQYKNDVEKATRSLQSKTYKLDQLLTLNSKLESKIQFNNLSFERANQEHKSLMNSDKILDNLIETNQKELEEITEKKDLVHNELLEYQQRKLDCCSEITNLNRKVAFSVAKKHDITRETNSVSRMIQHINVQINEEKVFTEQEKNMKKMVKENLSSKKKEIQHQDFISSNYEKETMNLVDRTNNIKTQLLRFDDNIKLLQIENENAEENLKKLTNSLEVHDKLNHETRLERDQLSNKISFVERDNEKLRIQLNEEIENVEKLKQRKIQATENIINVHFQTRGLEKQIQSLQSFIKVTQNVHSQILTTVVGYKSEGQKLRLILDEARKDIQSAKSEILNIKEMKKIIQNQLLIKDDTISKDSHNSISLLNLLKSRQKAAQELAKQTSVLGEELENQVSKYHYLSKKAAAAANLKVLLVRLESQVQREQEYKNACINEFCRPTNVHRWMIMKMIHPDQFKNIQLIDFLKTKIEEVKREQIKLDDQKNNLLRQIKSGKATIKSCKITNGDNALNVYKNDLAKKDKEIEKIKKEIDEIIQQKQEVIEAIDLLKNKLKQGYVAAPFLKKQLMMLNLPQQKIHTVSGLDKTRLGGGFNINTNQEKTPRFFITESKTDENEPVSSRNEKLNTRPKTSLKSNINLNTNNSKIKVRPQSAINKRPNINTNHNNAENSFATVEVSSQLKNIKPNADLKTARKKSFKTGKIQLKKNEESVSTPRIEFSNSQLSARRTKEDKPKHNSSLKNASSRPGSSAQNNNASWKPKPVVKPAVGPYFGPL